MKSSIESAYAHISARRARPWKGEEEVRIAWVSALENALGIHFDAERAKKDSSYNNVVIEFKAPGLFGGSKSSAKFKEATEDRLLPYILRESEKSTLPSEDYIGIAIDGEHICFAQVRDQNIQTQHLVPFSEYAVGLVIQAIKADTRRAITTENLLADFGHGATTARNLMQAMADALAANLSAPSSSKIKMMFEEWRTLYGQVSEMSVLQAEAIEDEIGFGWSGNMQQALSGRLFVIHSYNSLLIKLLAAEIVSAHGLTATEQPAQAMAALLDNQALLNTLQQDIEKAGIFKQAGISGFVEEAIFSWYLDVADKPKHAAALMPALRGLLAALSLYRTDHLKRTRDVLRDLYQGLVPGKLRQSLGEFYTPDWLVDFTLKRAERGAWLSQRVLDPTCGSGAFLSAVIRKKRAEAAKAGWSVEHTVEHLCSSVWGFDLNPLAVQTARVNFLMEIADLLKAVPGQSFEVPVLLADAIYSPAPNPGTGHGVVKYKIGSQVAGLTIILPEALAFNRERLDLVFAKLGSSVEAKIEYAAAEMALISAGLLTPEEAAEWREPLKYTYDQILNLHHREWNGIWFRIARNFFWSATAGHFDCIVGNPPWVRWSKLPEAYRERVKPTCERYGIFSRNKLHGGNELDISAMITYTASDKWLKPGGRLAFVLTGALFKNPSSAGFRQFRIDPKDPDTMHLAPTGIDDLKALKPFEDAVNHTSVAVFVKSKEPGTYPIPYRLWNSADSYTKAIPADLDLEEVLKRVSIMDNEAAPVGEDGSPWAVLSVGRHDEMKGLAGKCKWVAGRKGITVDLNGVYFVSIVSHSNSAVQVRSRPEAGKKDIGPSRKAWVEPHMLYPLIKGAGDFEPCYLRLDNPAREKEALFTFVPNTGISSADYAAAASNMNGRKNAKASAWFENYEKLLNDRSTYRRQMKGAPYFAIYNVGEYTFQPWKVVWPEMCSRFYAAVAGSADVPVAGPRPYIPDHKVYYAAFDDKEPAYFLCGLLNTPLVREWVESHNVSIQIGDVFKHMRLPEYDPSDKKHKALSALVEKAHREHDAPKRRKLVVQIQADGEDIIHHWM
ncbi:SAM-dependent methyltransferase (plasmid) [Azospirillum brasilense]|uniref:site-specific DNA-methyltransferase (adenine-specific) n=1 Tax=Azospirillum brasilense TaxID=192 RepID=A0A4D8R1H1_AZOBR|nr:N-6 DNA methylase [Azospirillum brasilense]QCO16988.1 SAM-dependent methyltransferase [Azospirillum brasilense]